MSVHDVLEDLGRPRPGDGVRHGDGDTIVATYVLQGAPTLAAAAQDVAIEESTGTRTAPDHVTKVVGGEVTDVEVAGTYPIALPAAPLERRGIGEAELGRVTIAWPSVNATSLPALLSLVTGEANETGTFGACRLVALDLPDAVLERFPGPRHGLTGTFAAAGVEGRPLVGAIVKPSTGLDPEQFAEIAGALARGGVDFVKDDELLTDPAFCPFAARVQATRASLAAVEAETGRRILYAPNATGALEGLDDRVSLARAAGCGMVMLNALAVGLDVLRWAAGRAGVPVLAHRVISGALTRAPAVGMSPGVLCGLTRLAGGDIVQVGGVQGKIFEDDATIGANAEVCTAPLGEVAPAVPMSGGGQSDLTVEANRALFGTPDFCHLLGSVATDDAEGPTAAVARTIAAWCAIEWESAESEPAR